MVNAGKNFKAARRGVADTESMCHPHPHPVRRDLVLSCRECGWQTAPTVGSFRACLSRRGPPPLSLQLSRGHRHAVTVGKGYKGHFHQLGAFCWAAPCSAPPGVGRGYVGLGWQFHLPLLPHPVPVLHAPSLFISGEPNMRQAGGASWHGRVLPVG